MQHILMNVTLPQGGQLAWNGFPFRHGYVLPPTGKHLGPFRFHVRNIEAVLRNEAITRDLRTEAGAFKLHMTCIYLTTTLNIKPYIYINTSPE